MTERRKLLVILDMCFCISNLLFVGFWLYALAVDAAPGSTPYLLALNAFAAGASGLAALMLQE